MNFMLLSTNIVWSVLRTRIRIIYTTSRARWQREKKNGEFCVSL